MLFLDQIGELAILSLSRWVRIMWHTRTVLAAMMVSFVGFGCEPQGKTYQFHPVHGRVLTAPGQSVRGGTVTFSLPDDPDLVARGEVGDNGQFELTSYTARPNRTAPGAPAGRYRVNVTGPLVDDTSGLNVDLPTEVTINPGDNDITLQLPSATPKQSR